MLQTTDLRQFEAVSSTGSPLPHLAKAEQTCPAIRRDMKHSHNTSDPPWACREAQTDLAGPLDMVSLVARAITTALHPSNLFRSSSPRNETSLELLLPSARSSPFTPLRLFQEPLTDLARGGCVLKRTPENAILGSRPLPSLSPAGTPRPGVPSAPSPAPCKAAS